MSYIGNAISEMERWSQLFNEKFFKNELPQAMITIQKSRPNNYGHCTKNRIWRIVEDEPRYEININASSLDRNVVDIAGTILHELLHEYHNVNEIRGCNGNIHNKKFKTLAESVGFRVEQSKKNGWGHTFVDNDTELMNFIVNEIKPDDSVFKFVREIEGKPEPKTRKKSSFKYICPQCDNTAKAKEDANLMCGDCECKMERED